MKTIRIKDNSQTSKSEFFDVEDLTQKIADKTLDQLEKEGIFVFPDSVLQADDVSKDQKLLESVNGFYVTGNVMGFLGLGDQRLTICSRFDKEENDFFFQYLLSKVLNFNLVDLKVEANANNTVFDLLIFLFPYHLKKALRKGTFKTYVCNEFNDSHVKGTIDFSRHITKNTPFLGNIAYKQRQLLHDNFLMELLRHTIEVIKQKSYGNKILSTVKDEVGFVIDSTKGYDERSRKKIVSFNKQNIVRHAYYREYRVLQQLCILILQHEKQQIGAGARQVFGVLFDGAWLWEEYVNLLVGEKFHHPKNKAGEGEQTLFEHKQGVIFPDFIGKNENGRIIADAKYKPNFNIKNKDYLQLLAYMFRFDAKKGFFLYPESDAQPDVTLNLNRGCSYEKNVCARGDICVIKHGLQIPEGAKDYASFVNEIQKSEIAFKKTL